MNNAIAKEQEFPEIDSNLLEIQQQPWVILCDFDGTISLSDVTDTLLTEYGEEGYLELENSWLNGEIGSRECMSKQIALINANKEELDRSISTIKIDPKFPAFIEQAQKMGIEVKIVSDGLDYAIKRILAEYNLDHLQVYANHLEQVGDRAWKLSFPEADRRCVQACGNCKCARVEVYHQRQERVLLIGDGTSDLCASGVADYVLAKDKLLTYCQEQGNPYSGISGFNQALKFIEHKLTNVTELKQINLIK